MDELEQRVAALELLLMERLALDPPGVWTQIADNLAGGDDVDPDEAVIRAQAEAILDDARRRFDAFTLGRRLR